MNPDADGYARDVQELEARFDERREKIRKEVARSGYAHTDLLNHSLMLLDAEFLWDVAILRIEWGMDS